MKINSLHISQSFTNGLLLFTSWKALDKSAQPTEMKSDNTWCDRRHREIPVTVRGKDETDTVVAVCQITLTRHWTSQKPRWGKKKIKYNEDFWSYYFFAVLVKYFVHNYVHFYDILMHFNLKCFILLLLWLNKTIRQDLCFYIKSKFTWIVIMTHLTCPRSFPPPFP